MTDVSDLLAETSRRELCEPSDHIIYDIPAYGFIERIELLPTHGPLANTDARMRYTLEVVLRDPSGKALPVQAEIVFRDIKARVPE